MPKPHNFLAGVIEGFYGPPWTQAERRQLFDWMALWGLNTYLYAPKDDLKHRVLWREPYSAPEAETLKELIVACQQRNLLFIYALGPGLDIHYSCEPDLDLLRSRFDQMLSLGCHHFALLFDDIPDRLDPADIQRWGSLASAQCHVANTLFRWTRQRFPGSRFFFCPTAYCTRMAESKLGGEGYLATLGAELLPEIDIFWTGPEIISPEITVSHLRELQSVLCRMPTLWDNLFANDYDGRRFYCGPYAGRPPELRNEVRGLLCNPNNEFPLNFVPLHTLAAFSRAEGVWDARQAYLSAMQEWLPHFSTAGSPVAFNDLVFLGDCYYLPYEDGPEADAFYQLTRHLLSRNPAEWGEQALAFRKQATRLRDFCARLAELRQRPLFYALSRRLWELREELDLLDRYVAFRFPAGHSTAPFRSDYHLPGTFRGGMVSRLQRLLIQHPDGSFEPVLSDTAAQSNHLAVSSTPHPL